MSLRVSLAILTLAAGGVIPGMRPGDRHEFTQVHMGLPVRIVLHAGAEAQARAAAADAFARVAALEQIFSDYRDDSELGRLMARAPAPVPVSAELFAVVARAIDIARMTEGAFDPSVGPLVALWREARRTRRLPGPEAIEAARALVGWNQIALDPAARTIRLPAGMRLDLGGIAKGYILQQALGTLAARGITRALVEAGGDIVVGDAPPGRDGWRIETIGAAPAFSARAARLTHAAIATSGPTSQFIDIAGVRYSHVIDPRSGLGLTHDRVARVIAPDGATADALATALTVADVADRAAILQRFPAAIVDVAGG